MFWQIKHGLNKPVHVMIADDTGEIVYGDLRIADMNTAIASFTLPLTGTAHVV